MIDEGRKRLLAEMDALMRSPLPHSRRKGVNDEVQRTA
jgi:hypothetical protein